MLRVALTGGIGSGKSAVAHMLRALGAHVSQSDEVARDMMQPGQPLFDSIVAHFGLGIVRPDGELDRALLARLAFDEGRLEELNALVHPTVIAQQTHWMNAVGQAEPGAVAVVESALVLETGHTLERGEAPWRTRFDRIVVVSAQQQLRQQRYISRVSAAHPRHAEGAADDFQRRLAVQWTDEEREALADSVVRNDGSLQELQDRVAKLYDSLCREVADRQHEAM